MTETPDGEYVLASDYETLKAERDALKADAERYRWLREHLRGPNSQQPFITSYSKDTNQYGLLCEKRADNLIDAAREVKP